VRCPLFKIIARNGRCARPRRTRCWLLSVPHVHRACHRCELAGTGPGRPGPDAGNRRVHRVVHAGRHQRRPGHRPQLAPCSVTGTTWRGVTWKRVAEEVAWVVLGLDAQQRR